MASFKVTARDYVDLKETLSEKNIINTVGGKEYVVKSIEGTVLSPIVGEEEQNPKVINPNTVSRIFSSKPYNNNNARYNKDLLRRSADDYITLLNTPGGPILDEDYARTEALFFKGEYEFTTNVVINDLKSLACNFVINYTKSDTDSLYGYGRNYWIIDNKTAFFGFGGEFPMSAEQLETTKFLDVKNGVAIAKTILNYSEIIAYSPKQTEYCNAEVIETTESYTKIRVKYNFRIWAAWSGDNGWEGNTVLCVDKITINTTANTVDTDEKTFHYQGNMVNTERKYELETNELFQTTLDERDENKLSYKTYEKIANAFDVDRRIITFDLLNPVKVEIDDNIKYTEGRTQERYLDTDDEFSIYDGHDEYIGDFKVIQSNPVWDGSYHKIITAMLIE